MISIYQLKPSFQRLLRPAVAFLARHHISANCVTVSAFILSCLVGGITGYEASVRPVFYLLLPVFLFVRMALNAFDGMLAREYNQQTRLGAILNEMGDILSDLVLYIPFLYVRHVNMWLILFFSILLILTETAGIMGLQIQASRRYDGPMGKSDRAFWIGLMGLLAAFGWPSTTVTQWVMVVLNMLMLYTVWNRVVRALGEKNE